VPITKILLDLVVIPRHVDHDLAHPVRGELLDQILHDRFAEDRHHRFGRSLVSGRTRVPCPAARIMPLAMMVCSVEIQKSPSWGFYLMEIGGVADGTRTHDNQNHNLGLYQLSYSHRRNRDYSADLGLVGPGPGSRLT
jgi:hypothetical protein